MGVFQTHTQSSRDSFETHPFEDKVVTEDEEWKNRLLEHLIPDQENYMSTKCSLHASSWKWHDKYEIGPFIWHGLAQKVVA